MLLAMLALRPNLWLSMEWIADRLWSDGPPRSGVANVRSYVAELTFSSSSPCAQQGCAAAHTPAHTPAVRFLTRLWQPGQRQGGRATGAGSYEVTAALAALTGEPPHSPTHELDLPSPCGR